MHWNDKFNHSHSYIYPISGQESIVKSKGPPDMSAETFPLCFSAERCCYTQSLGTRDEGQLPRQLKTQPSQPDHKAISMVGPWKGLAVGVVGVHIEVEVGEGKTETEGFPEGWWK